MPVTSVTGLPVLDILAAIGDWGRHPSRSSMVRKLLVGDPRAGGFAISVE